MDLRALAESVLYGTTWDEKLINLPLGSQLTDSDPGQALAIQSIPDAPGRPAEMARFGKTSFPELRDLERDAERGRILHFFANHELLAMELMALALVRFPDGPKGWRMGVAHTLLEEQEHMRLYRDRMQALGVAFGDLPVNGNFWQRMSRMRSPMDYITMMSLTFEQANLDYCIHYRDAVRTIGDDATADILQRVYDDEISHVGHGSEWFDRLRPVDQRDQWDAYCESLPPPLTPVRARGIGFDVEGRRRAGLTQRFIDELRVCGASKGRLPVVWWYNPLCELETSAAAVKLPAAVHQAVTDLSTVPGLLAQAGDVVWTEHEPETQWRAQLQAAGWSLPEFRQGAMITDVIREQRLAACQPWGWSQRSVNNYDQLTQRVAVTASAPDVIASWASKLRTAQWLREHDERTNVSTADSIAAIQAAIDRFGIVVVKQAYGTAGSGNRRLGPAALRPAEQRWLEQAIVADGGVVVEPWRERIGDLSLQAEIDAAGRSKIIGIRRQDCDAAGHWRGVRIGSGIGVGLDFNSEIRAWLNTPAADGRSPLAALTAMSEQFITQLSADGYRGPVAIDAFVYRQADGSLALQPLVECNPRWTMGRVALAVEQHLAPGCRAWWGVLPIRSLQVHGWESAAAWIADLQQRHPLVRRQNLVSTGVLATSDTNLTGQKLVSVLLAGDARHQVGEIFSSWYVP